MFGLGLRSAIPRRRPRRAQGTAARGAAWRCSSGSRTMPACRGWSRRSTRSATTPTRAWPRICCSARRSGQVFDPEEIADQPYVRETLAGHRSARRSLRRRLPARPDDGRAVRRPAARSRVFPPVQLHRAGGPAGLPQPAGARGPGAARPAVGRGPAAAAGADLQADRGAAPAGADHARADGQGAGGTALFPRAPAGEPCRCDRLLRPDALQRGDHDPGERDLRQDRLRPGAGDAADRRADHRSAGPAGAARGGDGGGAGLARRHRRQPPVGGAAPEARPRSRHPQAPRHPGPVRRRWARSICKEQIELRDGSWASAATGR